MRFTLYYLLFFSASASAQQEYIVTASSLYHPGDHSGGEVTVISKKEIQQDQDLFVQDALRDAPSVHVAGTGDNGRVTNFSMRGATGGENLVMIDGVPVNDPSASSGLFDFADMMVDDLEQIEILPGANSVIYGSDAMGGIINMVTKSGKGKPSAKFNAEGGSFHTGKGSGTIQGEQGPLSFSFTGSGFRSGEGSFKNKVHGNRQGDKYRNGLGSGRVSYALAPNLEAEGVFRWSEAKVRFDNFMGNLPRKANNNTRTRNLLGQTKLHGSFFDDVWEQILSFSHTETNRRHTMTGMGSRTRGQQYKINSRSDVNWSEKHLSTLGGDYAWERVNSTFSGKHQRDKQGLFAQHLARLWKGGEIVVGTRFDHIENVGERMTYRSAISHTIDQTRLRASYGTGYKAPLLEDLFNTSPFAIPNKRLRPEKNHSVDVGFDQKFWANKAELNITAFLNVIEDVIITNRVGSKFQRINGGRRVAKGFEGKLRVDPFPWLGIQSNLTFVHSRDRYRGMAVRSPHMPRLVVNGKVIIRPFQDTRIFASTHYVSSQRNAFPNRGLQPYATMTIGGGYDVTSEVQAFGRVENVTDKRYEESYGYGVRGRAFYIGLRAVI